MRGEVIIYPAMKNSNKSDASFSKDVQGLKVAAYIKQRRTKGGFQDAISHDIMPEQYISPREAISPELED